MGSVIECRVGPWMMESPEWFAARGLPGLALPTRQTGGVDSALALVLILIGLMDASSLAEQTSARDRTMGTRRNNM